MTRLIDADALKNDLKQYFTDGVLDGVSAKLAFNQILHDIDNAPTVDIKDELAGAYNEGYVCGNKEAEKGRPRGEWIKITKNGTIPVEYICSVCGRKIFDNYELLVPQSMYYPFCHCGADMRRGGTK